MISAIILWIEYNILWIQFGLGIFCLIALGFIIYYLIKLNFLLGESTNYISEAISKANLSKKRSLKAWMDIERHLLAKKGGDLRLAVIEADKILGEILKMAEYPGKNLDEQLELITEAQISNIQELQQAHKIRNRLASEPDFLITFDEAKIALTIYRRTFRELNLLEY